jgi:tRNA (cmo5U34)-methyltransferase
MDLAPRSRSRSEADMADDKHGSLSPFSDPDSVARYAEGPRRIVPGFADLHRMSTLLLAERVPHDGRVLVLGAGGGLELKTFAEAHPGWTFDGVDPSSEMLKLAEQTLGPFASRVRLHQGYIDDAPEAVFDAAACLLTFHFMDPTERRHAASGIHRRLRPGSPFVVAHLSIPSEGGLDLWLSRYAAFARRPGSEVNLAAIRSHTHILTPEDDEAILRDAGFSGISLFYAGFTFRGWVAYA